MHSHCLTANLRPNAAESFSKQLWIIDKMLRQRKRERVSAIFTTDAFSMHWANKFPTRMHTPPTTTTTAIYEMHFNSEPETNPGNGTGNGSVDDIDKCCFAKLFLLGANKQNWSNSNPQHRNAIEGEGRTQKLAENWVLIKNLFLRHKWLSFKVKLAILGTKANQLHFLGITESALVYRNW